MRRLIVTQGDTHSWRSTAGLQATQPRACANHTYGQGGHWGHFGDTGSLGTLAPGGWKTERQLP